MNITINELSRKTGISAYEIRRRVKNGILPHVRIGAKKSKILIDEDVFDRMLAEESINNAKVRVTDTADSNSDETTGFGKIREIS